MITIYGIKNCDTCRKALKWLDAEKIEHRFHDFRADGLDGETLRGWIGAVGWETLLNRRGTTWRKLPDTEKQSIDGSTAAGLMLANPTLIKRPVVETGGKVIVGFKDAEQSAISAASGR